MQSQEDLIREVSEHPQSLEQHQCTHCSGNNTPTPISVSEIFAPTVSCDNISRPSNRMKEGMDPHKSGNPFVEDNERSVRQPETHTIFIIMNKPTTIDSTRVGTNVVNFFQRTKSSVCLPLNVAGMVTLARYQLINLLLNDLWYPSLLIKLPNPMKSNTNPKRTFI
ncbi:hypothetical protein WICPIJ_003512 [Wickerhamomyces pijperi]|uniref:Uncharacterized protein n=1 Tax=Wickerhamomyces pijperi TaxID=599730 RepID=A0A9P8TMY3_WICPI|nr:hypothetical protein WICPIJ_003512 [Wickerhamomyces pijperi]